MALGFNCVVDAGSKVPTCRKMTSSKCTQGRNDSGSFPVLLSLLNIQPVPPLYVTKRDFNLEPKRSKYTDKTIIMLQSSIVNKYAHRRVMITLSRLILDCVLILGYSPLTV